MEEQYEIECRKQIQRTLAIKFGYLSEYALSSNLYFGVGHEQSFTELVSSFEQGMDELQSGGDFNKVVSQKIKFMRRRWQMIRGSVYCRWKIQGYHGSGDYAYLVARMATLIVRDLYDILQQRKAGFS